MGSVGQVFRLPPAPLVDERRKWDGWSSTVAGELLVVVVWAAVCDMVSTARVLARPGGFEHNPLMVPIVGHPVEFAAVKAAQVLAVVAVAVLLRRRVGLTLVWLGLCAAGGVMVAVGNGLYR